MNLYEKLNTTQTGHLANIIGSIVYEHTAILGKRCCDQLTFVQTQLEALAIAELETEVQRELEWLKQIPQRKLELVAKNAQCAQREVGFTVSAAAESTHGDSSREPA